MTERERNRELSLNSKGYSIDEVDPTSITFQIDQDPLETGVNFYKSNRITLQPGLTVLIGCNGAGKTTFINQIETICEDNDISVFSFRNIKEGGNNFTESMLVYETAKGARRLTQSEGENIYDSLLTIATRIAKVVKSSTTKTISNRCVVIMDGIDSGLSIDALDDIKNDLLKFIPEVEKDNGMNVYMIVTANNFEFVQHEQCFDVVASSYKTFKTYSVYKKFIQDSSKKKEIRDKMIDKKRKERKRIESKRINLDLSKR